MKYYIIIIILIASLLAVETKAQYSDASWLNESIFSQNLELVNVDNPDDTTPVLARVHGISLRYGFVFLAALILVVSLVGIAVIYLIFMIIVDIIHGIAGGNKKHFIIILFILSILTVNATANIYEEDFKNANVAAVNLNYSSYYYQGTYSLLEARNVLVNRNSVNTLFSSSNSYSNDGYSIAINAVDRNNADTAGVDIFYLYKDDITSRNIILNNDTYFVVDIKTTSLGMPDDKVSSIIWISSTSYVGGFYIWLNRNPAGAGCSILSAIGDDIKDHTFKRLYFSIRDIRASCSDIDMQMTLAGSPYITELSIESETKNGNTTNATYTIELDSFYINSFPPDQCGDTWIERSINCNWLGVSTFKLVNVDNLNDKGTILQRVYYFTMRQGLSTTAYLGVIIVTFIMIAIIYILFMIILDSIKGYAHKFGSPRMKR